MAKQYNPWTGFLEDTTAKANDSKTCDGKNEYEIHYTVPGKNGTMVGSGKGTSEQEAKEDFMAYHKSENPTVTKVKLYKSLDKAIRNCDESYTVSLKELSDRDASRVIGIAQRLGFTTKDKGYTVELIGGDPNMFNRFKREVAGIRGIKFI